MPNFSLPGQVFLAAAQQYQTPFHLYDETAIRRTARRLKAAFAWNPGFREYFAVKATPNPRPCRPRPFCASSGTKAAAWTAPA